MVRLLATFAVVRSPVLFIDNEDDWLAPNPNRRAADEEGESSGGDSDPDT